MTAKAILDKWQRDEVLRGRYGFGQIGARFWMRHN
jgi:hypothetical protein